jgi:hypothetical protein
MADRIIQKWFCLHPSRTRACRSPRRWLSLPQSGLLRWPRRNREVGSLVRVLRGGGEGPAVFCEYVEAAACSWLAGGSTGGMGSGSRGARGSTGMGTALLGGGMGLDVVPLLICEIVRRIRQIELSQSRGIREPDGYQVGTEYDEEEESDGQPARTRSVRMCVRDTRN